MTFRLYPDWQSFAYKYRGREQAAFEDLARTLFRKELGKTVGLFQRINQKGNETQVIEVEGRIIGFQAKYFKDTIDELNIIHSMRGAKEDNPRQTHYYIYSNLSFGEPKRRKGTKKTDPKPEVTRKEEAIDKVAKELGLTIVWKLDKSVLDEANESEWIYDVFFNVEGKMESLIIEESKHTDMAFASIGYACRFHDQIIHVTRDQTIKRLETLPSSSLYIIHGEGGCGKTAILHEFLEKHREDYPVYYRKASVLNVQSLAQVFFQGNLYTMDDFKDAYKGCQRKYYIIDSAEHLEAMTDESIVPSLIRMLIEQGWCVVFTVRTAFLSDLLNYLSLILKLKNVQNESVQLLTDQELTSISRKYRIQLPIDATLKDRLRNLFYLNLYTRYYDEIDGKADDKAFLQFIWEKKIRGKDTRKGYIRENVFEAFVEDKLRTGQVFLSPNKYTSEEFYSLIEDDVIALDPVRGLFITHDIFEEWGLYRFVERIWQKNTTINGFLLELGETRSIRRTFRLWLNNKVKENVEVVTPLAQTAFTDRMPELWKDEVLCAVLTSDKASLLLADVEGKILNNTDGFRDKVIWALRVGSQYVQEVVRLKDFFWPRYLPFGSGWSYVIDLIYQKRAGLDLLPWLPVLLDWTKANYHSEITRKAGLAVIEYYQSDEYGKSRYLDGVKKMVCEIICNAAQEIKDELKELLEQCMMDDNMEDDLPLFVLHKNTSAMNIHISLPNVVADLCLHYWQEDNDDKHKYYYSHYRRDAFGIDDNRAAARYFPPGSGQTPTLMLLLTEEKVAVDFIIRLMNGCVEHYAQSENGKNLIKVEIRDEDGVKNWQWHSAVLWGMYRGMDVSPNTLQAVHMALEKYLLDLSEEGKNEQCEQVLRRLLFECKSSSVSAVATSIVLAYPQKYWEVALILFRTVEFFGVDNQRALRENSMRTLYGISSILNPSVTKERLETCGQEFRKLSLENICLNYQFFGNRPELNEEQGESLIAKIYAILDEHRKLLKMVDNQEQLEIQLSRMDRRLLTIKEKKKVNGGFQIQFETNLGEKARKMSEEVAVAQRETCKYLGLQTWAMAKLKGETLPAQSYGDDWAKVLKETQALQEDLERGRASFYTDGYTAAWVASCLLKIYSEQIPKKGLEWCKTVVDQKLIDLKGVATEMDGTAVCIDVIPRLIELFPEEKDKYFRYLLNCLLIPDYENHLSLRNNALTAVRTFDLWTKEPGGMQKLVDMFIETVDSDERKDAISALNGVAGLIPDNPNDQMIQYVVCYLKRIPQMMKEIQEASQAMFSLTDNLASLFVRVNSQEILNCLEFTKLIIEEPDLGDSFLTHIIIEADTRNKPDRFWMIWNAYRDLLPSLVRMGYNPQLRTYLLNIRWVDGIKEWRCIRKEDLSFFSFVANNCGGNAIALECLAKALTDITHSYLTEGMAWLSGIVADHMNMNLSGTNALFYLEQVMMEYSYSNKMQIRKNPDLHKQVRTILNFMVNKSSVTGYVLRDMVN